MKDASFIGVFSAEAGEAPPSWHTPIPAPRKSGRPRGARDPRIGLDESRALLYTLGDGPTAIAARLGVTRQAVDRALRTGLSVRMARRWKLIAPD